MTLLRSVAKQSDFEVHDPADPEHAYRHQPDHARDHRGIGIVHTDKPKELRQRGCGPFPAVCVADIVLRCTRAALDEARGWGAQLVVAKGDITHHSRPDEWALAREILAGGPVVGTVGNHDVKAGPLTVETGLDLAVDGVLVRDEPGVRIVVVDATLPRRHPGSLRHADAVIDAAAGTDDAVVVVLHHQLHRTPFPTHWPPGIMAPSSTRFLRQLAAANRRAVVTSGHTHRCRARRAGPVLVTEVGSVKDHPGGWAGYVVHEGGIRQVVRRTMQPDVLRWTEDTKRALFGIWGRWSPGTIDDRCVRHAWPA